MGFELNQDITASHLFRRPGFLIRRLHQIHIALFAEETSGFDITPAQYSILTIIEASPGLDQAQIAEDAGVDRATLANVVARLEAGGYLKRIPSRLDRRQKLLTLTAKALAILDKMEEPVQRAHTRTIATLPPEDRAMFMHLLTRLAGAANPHARAKPRLK